MLKKLGVERIVLLAVVEDIASELDDFLQSRRTGEDEDAGLRRNQRDSTQAGDETKNLTNSGQDREGFVFVHRINLSEYGDENWRLAWAW